MKNTPQTKLVFDTVQKLGHATNQQILDVIRSEMPELSITTVHRITKRLVEGGMAQYAPSKDGVAVVDANTANHHHFVCGSCHGVIDIDLPEYLVEQVQEQIGDNIAAGGLTINGSCAACVAANPNLSFTMRSRKITKEIIHE